MTTPPFSPVLVGGLVLRTIPLRLVQTLAGRAARRLQERHPGVFERMTPLGPRTFLIDALDLPWRFEIAIADGKGTVAVLARDGEEPVTDARIHAPLAVLFGLLDGTIDGDAMFFTRDMTYEGDTEAVVALRNALDGAGIDLAEDLASAFGPFAGSARAAIGRAVSLYRRMEADCEALSRSLSLPAEHQAEAQGRRIAELEDRCIGLERLLRKGRSVPN